jgi:hypothetical protein
VARLMPKSRADLARKLADLVLVTQACMDYGVSDSSVSKKEFGRLVDLYEAAWRAELDVSYPPPSKP